MLLEISKQLPPITTADTIPNGTSLIPLGYTDWKLGVTKDFGGGLSLWQCLMLIQMPKQ
jgi:hypothetical protein